MPLIAINLSDKLFQSIKELVEGSKYQSFESFLEIAAFNQMALERGATPAELIARGHRRGERESDPSQNGAGSVQVVQATTKTNKEEVVQKRRTRQAVGKSGVEEKVVLEQEDMAKIIQTFALEKMGDKGPRPIDVTMGAKDDHLFGQVNRLFPLKLACRWLAVEAHGAIGEEWPVYATISDRIGDDAAKLGSLLEQWDASANRKRDEVLATGLPRQGNSASRDRFLSQFLARLTRGGEIYPGAICQYRLAGFERDRIALTQRGLDFALLKNPILDAPDPKNVKAFSHEEADLLAQQVAEWVPCEHDDMRIILRAIASGKVVPKDLTDDVRSKFSAGWSDAMLMTHISGLIARLGDLGLLERKWQGRNVNYELGEKTRVETFLKD